MSLQRFVAAQEGVYETALAELRAGAKRTHWMWFVFPQLRGLGRSANAERFAIADPDEAVAYLSHPVLGPRLLSCATAMLDHRATDAATILGPVDAMKLRSCATLFEATQGAPPVFGDLLDTFHDGARCTETLRLLA